MPGAGVASSRARVTEQTPRTSGALARRSAAGVAGRAAGAPARVPPLRAPAFRHAPLVELRQSASPQVLEFAHGQEGAVGQLHGQLFEPIAGTAQGVQGRSHARLVQGHGARRGEHRRTAHRDWRLFPAPGTQVRRLAQSVAAQRQAQRQRPQHAARGDQIAGHLVDLGGGQTEEAVLHGHAFAHAERDLGGGVVLHAQLFGLAPRRVQAHEVAGHKGLREAHRHEAGALVHGAHAADGHAAVAAAAAAAHLVRGGPRGAPW